VKLGVVSLGSNSFSIKAFGKSLAASVLFIFVLNLSGCASGSVGAPVTQRSKTLNRHTQTYLVRRGDTLFSIAWQSRKEVGKLAQWNGIKKPYTIYPGQKIKLSEKSKSRKPFLSTKKQLAKSKKIATKPQKKQLVKKNLKKILKVRWQWPLKGSLEKKFSSKNGRDGIDIVAKRQVIVKAAAAGKVVYSGSGLIGYGNLLIIKHNDEFLSAYGFNRRLLAKEGAFVKAGEGIAEAGFVDGLRKLHFEIRRKGKPVNPLHYLPR
jgi:lipoprotein NlpD